MTKIKLLNGCVKVSLQSFSPLCQVIFIDNWRVLHGRDSFTGLRRLCGCYLTRDDVVNKARSLGLQA